MWCGIIYLVSWTVDVYNGQLWLECANIQMHKLYQVIRASSAESIWSGVRHCVWSMGWLKRFCFCSLRMCLCLTRRLNIHKNTIDSVVFQLSHGVSMTSFEARKLLSMYCRQAHCKLNKLLAQFFSKDLWAFSIWCISDWCILLHPLGWHCLYPRSICWKISWPWCLWLHPEKVDSLIYYLQWYRLHEWILGWLSMER